MGMALGHDFGSEIWWALGGRRSGFGELEGGQLGVRGWCFSVVDPPVELSL